MSIKIDGQEFSFDPNNAEKSIVEFAHENNIEIPTLCFLKDCANIGKCGLCSVIVNDKKSLACRVNIEDGMEIITANSESEAGESIKAAINARVSKMLETHDFACGKCSRKDSCEFLDLVKFSKARAAQRYAPTPEEYSQKVDTRSSSLVIDRNKCVTCSRCQATCAFKTSTESIKVGKLPENIGNGRGVCPVFEDELTDKSFDETKCLLCGQCLLSCPVAALNEKSHIERVEEALQDDSKHVVFAMAPAVRTSLGESFGMDLGTDVTGKIYTACRDLGANKVFDINFAADVTILEEGTELLQRLGLVEGGHSKTLPMFTSCCPGWMRLVDKHAPELIPHISSTKSPQQIFGAAAKTYYPQTEGLNPEDIFVVTIMPCIAKKYESEREDGMFGASGNKNIPDIDAVLTTRELAQMIKKNKIDFANLEDSEADQAMGEYTGAGTIFGVSGGVMEAALRTAADLVSGKSIESVDYEAVAGFNGVREATIQIPEPSGGEIELHVAVVNGAANFFKLQSEGSLDKYHFIEVMACPGGCINGGGQPHVSSHEKLNYAKTKSGEIVNGHFAGTGDALPEYIFKRASVLRKQDEDGNYTDKKRKSHENQAVLKMYQHFDVKPGEKIAHDLFHLDNNSTKK